MARGPTETEMNFARELFNKMGPIGFYGLDDGSEYPREVRVNESWEDSPEQHRYYLALTGPEYIFAAAAADLIAFRLAKDGFTQPVGGEACAVGIGPPDGGFTFVIDVAIQRSSDGRRQAVRRMFRPEDLTVENLRKFVDEGAGILKSASDNAPPK